jgi:hypothetical protein
MPAQRKYPDELRERAVRMVLEIRQREGKGHGELARVGRQLGVHPEALRACMLVRWPVCSGRHGISRSRPLGFWFWFRSQER